MLIDTPSIKTPNLDNITSREWFLKQYNFEQLKEVDDLIENHIWITANKVKIYVKNMKTSLIQNCINCWNGTGNLRIPKDYLGGKEKWLRIFQNELTSRQ